MKVKICGITNVEDALICEQLGADALGFIFFIGSKRYISPADAKRITAALNPFTIKVGVFVDENPQTVNYIASDVGLNFVQLHGNESRKYITCIKHPVIKSFRVNDSFDYETLKKYKDLTILLDSYSDKEFGGTGTSFNWELIPEEIKNKVILAGGITAENLHQVIENIKPAAIDVSSSLEKEPGKKDADKVKSFFNKLNSTRR